MNRITKAHLVLLLINLAMLAGFGWVFWVRRNYEFMTYVAVVGGAIAAVGLSLRRVPYTMDCLVAMTVWAGLHLAGGGVAIGEYGRLYDVMIWRVSDTWPILRYDQLAHIWGFAAATLLAHCLLSKSLLKPVPGPACLAIVLLMAGLGFGALNEIVEFIVSSVLKQTGVGGYLNTSLDLCSNLLGAAVAVVYLGVRGRLS